MHISLILAYFCLFIFHLCAFLKDLMFTKRTWQVVVSSPVFSKPICSYIDINVWNDRKMLVRQMDSLNLIFIKHKHILFLYFWRRIWNIHKNKWIIISVVNNSFFYFLYQWYEVFFFCIVLLECFLVVVKLPMRVSLFQKKKKNWWSY